MVLTSISHIVKHVMLEIHEPLCDDLLVDFLIAKVYIEEHFKQKYVRTLLRGALLTYSNSIPTS